MALMTSAGLLPKTRVGSSWKASDQGPIPAAWSIRMRRLFRELSCGAEPVFDLLTAPLYLRILSSRNLEKRVRILRYVGSPVTWGHIALARRLRDESPRSVLHPSLIGPSGLIAKGFTGCLPMSRIAEYFRDAASDNHIRFSAIRPVRCAGRKSVVDLEHQVVCRVLVPSIE
jgi:hypothetical protein